MRIMLDTNIIISAALFPNGRASANTPKRSLFPADSNTADQLPSYNYKTAALLLR